MYSMGFARPWSARVGLPRRLRRRAGRARRAAGTRQRHGRRRDGTRGRPGGGAV